MPKHPPRTTKNSTAAAAASAQQMEEAQQQQQQTAPPGPTPETEQQGDPLGEPAAGKASQNPGTSRANPIKEVWLTKKDLQQPHLMNPSQLPTSRSGPVMTGRLDCQPNPIEEDPGKRQQTPGPATLPHIPGSGYSEGNDQQRPADAESIQTGFASSTPLTTPDDTFTDSPVIDVSDTPLGQGINHRLMSLPSPVHPVPDRPSSAAIEDCLNNLQSHIEHYGRRYMQDNWIDSFQQDAEDFSSRIDDIQSKCSTFGYTKQLAWCFDLRSKLKSHVDLMTAKANVMKANPHLERLRTSSFGGSGLPYGGARSKTPDRINDPLYSSALDHQSLNYSRMSSTDVEESPQSGLPSVASSVTDLHGTGENTVIKRPGSIVSHSIMFQHFSTRLRGIENRINEGTLQSRVDSRLANIEKGFVKKEDFTALFNKVVEMENKLSSLGSDMEHQVSNLEISLNDMKENCKMYETIANGVSAQNLSLSSYQTSQRERISALEEEIRNLRSMTAFTRRMEDFVHSSSNAQAQMGRPQGISVPVHSESSAQPVATSGVSTTANLILRPDIPVVSGISQLPTTVVTSVVGARSSGPSSNTTVIMSTGTAVTSSIQHSNVQWMNGFGGFQPGQAQAGNVHQLQGTQQFQQFQQSMHHPYGPTYQPGYPYQSGTFQPYVAGFNPQQPYEVPVTTESRIGHEDRRRTPQDNNPSPNSSLNTDNGSLSNAENLSSRGLRLKRDGKNLRRMLSPKVDSNLTRVVVQTVHKNLIIAVDQERKELVKSLERYENSSSPDSMLIEEIDCIIAEAQEWSAGMREKYRELDCDKQSLDKKLYSGLKKFGEDSELHIFEFLSKFEAYTAEHGTAKERAELLYDHYLQKEVQLELVDKQTDYKAMRKWLISRFGDIKVITDNILKTVAKEFLPGESSSHQTLAVYYRKLNSVIKKLQELSKTVDMPVSELEAHMYSAEFLTKLMKFVPRRTNIVFMDNMTSNGEDDNQVKGESAFKLLAKTIFTHFSSHNRSARVESANGLGKEKTQKEKSPPKKKTVHQVQVTGGNDTGTASDDESSCAVHYQHSTSKPSKNPTKNRAAPSGSKFRFPCTLQNHSHEVGECAEFFSLSPVERQKSGSKKVCFTCMGSRSKCQKACANLKYVPDVAICMKCKEWADKKKISPLNVLYCKKKEHKKPDNQELVDALKSWVKGFNSEKIHAPVKLAAHLQMIAYTKVCRDCKSSSCNCRPPTKSSPVIKSKPIPAINTNTGEVTEIDDDQIVTEVDEDAFYVMQLLKLQGEDCLTFFDRGANQHLIDGSMAERIGAKVLCDRPASLGVAGAGRIWTDYGRYSVYLGPTPVGKYHQITAQGISHVTEPFPHYDLAEVNKELKNSGYLPKKGLTLPKYIGGQRVNLLVGIKDTELEPQCLFQLPSGIGVYKSLFTDKFNSNICFGGPHNIFTSINKKCLGNLNHINVFFTQMCNQYRNSIYPALTRAVEPELDEVYGGVMYVKNTSPQYRLVTESGLSVFPTPLTSSDFNELGIPEVDETDEDIGDCSCHSHETETWAVNHSHTLGSVHKAKVPLFKLKEYLDKEDVGNTVNYRCSDCLNCKKCMVSDKVKMMSLQEQIEQEIIEKSVEVDLENKRILVDLPFIKPPVEYLFKKHGGDNNYYQALRVYKTQCRRPDRLKDGMKKMHADLVDRGFLKKLTDLTPTQQKIIKDSGFKHYMPWRSVEKTDSLSTPVRLVVDPSMSGLNIILAKGTNNLTKINSILLRNRCRRYIWTSDVSKLYNHLVLKDTALPYGLFLYNESMDPDIKPEVYVMTVAWYGVTSSGNQSGEGLEKLCRILQKRFPLAYTIIVQDRYVDDILSGSNNREEADEQVNQVKSAIEHGNFPLKFVVKSGMKPCEISSSDGNTVKVLGYRWSPEADILSPGFSEINFNRRRRGAKAPNPFPVVDPEDVSKLLDETNISKRMVISMLYQIFDPLGLWEPYKLQLKLEAKDLNGIDWDVALDKEVQEHWSLRFQQFLDIPHMTAQRCIIPDDAVDPGKMRLICISDAAVSAGGCAIYGSFLKTDGTYSCALLTAKSRMMKDSIPRNELEAVRLMAEVASDVKMALGTLVEEVLFFTDSTIAMSWCHNLNKKLRLFVFNRVSQVRRSIQEVAGSQEEFPLYHIDGKLNIADLLTKPHDISPTDLGLESSWHNGLDWMKLPLDKIPITRYEDISVSREEQALIDIECFPDPSFTANNIQILGEGVCDHTHCQGCRAVRTRIPLDRCYGTDCTEGHCDNCQCQIKFSSFLLKGGRGSQALVDVIQFGYLKTLRIMTHVIRFASTLIHKAHKLKGVEKSETCKKCLALQTTGGIPEEMDKRYTSEALNYFFRLESHRLKSITPKKKLDTFMYKDGIYYHAGRLAEENLITEKDLDFKVFYDSSSIKTVLPVVLSDSEIFFAFAMYIHHQVRIHSGVEITLKEVLGTMYVLNNPRRIIQKIRRQCSRCRIIAKKTLELEMSQHPDVRTQITPVFYNAMADTVFGFKGQAFKRARKTTKIYALIIVCLLTSAVSILCCEGLETQDVMQALERHSARYGVPGTLYVDKGTQLAALENVEFSLRDLTAQVHDSMGMRIVTSTAKSHEERGRVERKVRTLREMLEKLAVKDDTCMTALQWETLFSKLSSHVNDLPMAKSTRSNFTDATWDLLTPNRLLLGRNNSRSLESSFNLLRGAGATEILRRNQNLQRYFYQMMIDRIHHFMDRPEKWRKTDDVNVGDICIFIYNENAAMRSDFWKLGKVTNVDNPRKIEVTFAGNSVPGKLPKLKTIIRSPRQICVISAADDTDLNSREFFEKLKSEQ